MIVYTDKHRVPFEIDADDYEVVRRYTWRIHSNGYPETDIGKGSSQRSMKLHIFILGPAPTGLEWDHEDRNKLNNRRKNLRPLTHRENGRNVGLRSDNKSGVKGVSWFKARGLWKATIMNPDCYKTIGYFDTLEAATAARRDAEVKYWGESASNSQEAACEH